MTPKNVLLFALAAGFAWYQLPHRDTPFSTPVAAAERSGKAIVPQEFKPLFEAEAPLSSLAGDGVYTVVEVYIKTCSRCKQLERELPAFLKARNDVVVKRVHFPESGLGWPISEAAQMEQRMDAYKICGMPHIEIYGPDGQVVAQDDCAHKDALHFLDDWIAAERSST